MIREGKLTSYQDNGASTVEYGIVSEHLQNIVLGFQVQALTPYSDHCPITLKLACSNREIIYSTNTTKEPTRTEASSGYYVNKFLWKPESKDKFILSTLSSFNIQNRLEHHSSTDDEISQFNQILKSVAEISLVPSRRKHVKRPKKQTMV